MPRLGNGPNEYKCINAAYLNAVSDHALDTMKSYWNANADCDCCGGRGDIVSNSRQHKRTDAGKGYCTKRYRNHNVNHACEHCVYITDCFQNTYVLDKDTMKLKPAQLQLLQDA